MKVDERLQALQQMHVEFSIHNFNVKHEFFTKLRNTRWRLNLCPVMLYQQSKNFEIGQVSVLYLTIISLSCASYQMISCFWKFHYNPPPHSPSSVWSGPRIRRMLHYVPCVQRILYFFHGDATQLAAANNKQ